MGEAMRSMYETYQSESSEEVRTFYLNVSGASLVYFVSLPVLCMLSSLFEPWVRLKYVSRVEVLSRLVTTLLLAYCLRPSRIDTMIHSRLEEGFECERDCEVMEQEQQLRHSAEDDP